MTPRQLETMIVKAIIVVFAIVGLIWLVGVYIPHHQRKDDQQIECLNDPSVPCPR